MNHTVVLALGAQPRITSLPAASLPAVCIAPVFV